MIFDYDVSSCFPNHKGDFDTVMKLHLKGMTPQYAAPEILDAYLDNKIDVEINPFRADMYSLGKTVIAWITRCLNIDQMI